MTRECRGEAAFGAIPTLFLIIAIAFFMMRLAPGGPFDGERKLPPEIERNIAAAYHLDKPLWTSSSSSISASCSRAISAPRSRYKDFTVTELIWKGFPVSWRLGGGDGASSLGTTLGLWRR